MFSTLEKIAQTDPKYADIVISENYAAFQNSLYDLANVVPTLAKFYHQASESYEQACTRHINMIICFIPFQLGLSKMDLRKMIKSSLSGLIMQATEDFLLHGPRGGKRYLKRKLKLSPVEEDIREEEENKEEHEHSTEDESQQAPTKRVRRSFALQTKSPIGKDVRSKRAPPLKNKAAPLSKNRPAPQLKNKPAQPSKIKPPPLKNKAPPSMKKAVASKNKIAPSPPSQTNCGTENPVLESVCYCCH
ncbi:hypothetical protein IFM89_016112 [Coptis chinensis]|uniref:Uncharacterized protein n=1 Tax=Coptis chinensis TaxID=261450 RepID=A0A835MEQ6_9MAGN|nr:hypothetical protein IFM89_016112 [Coptis chinensis]